MKLPFTHAQFLDAFAAYNAALWPGALVLWLVTAWALVIWARRGQAASRALAALLAVHWAWSALAYHLAFFRAINPAALAFAVLFLVQSALFLWLGVVRRTLRWRLDLSATGVAASALIIYAMVYPALGLASGLAYPRMPVFGVPCPTLLLTAGVLLAAAARTPRLLNVIPIAWSAVGGSAAFLLGIRADVALLVAGVLLLAHTLAPRGQRKAAPRPEQAATV